MAIGSLKERSIEIVVLGHRIPWRAEFPRERWDSECEEPASKDCGHRLKARVRMVVCFSSCSNRFGELGLSMGGVFQDK